MNYPIKSTVSYYCLFIYHQFDDILKDKVSNEFKLLMSLYRQINVPKLTINPILAQDIITIKNFVNSRTDLLSFEQAADKVGPFIHSSNGANKSFVFYRRDNKITYVEKNID